MQTDSWCLFVQQSIKQTWLNLLYVVWKISIIDENKICKVMSFGMIWQWKYKRWFVLSLYLSKVQHILQHEANSRSCLPLFDYFVHLIEILVHTRLKIKMKVGSVSLNQMSTGLCWCKTLHTLAFSKSRSLPMVDNSLHRHSRDSSSWFLSSFTIQSCMMTSVSIFSLKSSPINLMLPIERLLALSLVSTSSSTRRCFSSCW